MIKLLRNFVSKSKYLNVFALVVILVSISVGASSLPSNYPKSFEWVGENQGLSSNGLVIEDREFQISPSVVLYKLGSINPISLVGLKDINIVGCKLDAKGKLLSIWELPDSYSEESGTALSRGR